MVGPIAKPNSTLAEVDDTEEYMRSKGCASGDVVTAKKYLKMVRAACGVLPWT